MDSPLRELRDIESIKQLKARYFRFMDTKQWDEWQWVFTEDARLKWGPEEGSGLQWSQCDRRRGESVA